MVRRISLHFLCDSGTFHDLLSTSHAFRSPSVIFRHLSCGRVVFCQLLSFFHATGRLSINFHQHSLPLGVLPSTSVNLPCGVRPSINIRQLSAGQMTFCKLSSPFCVAGRLTVCICQLSLWPGKPSINFHHLFVQPEDLSSLSINYSCGLYTSLSFFVSILCGQKTFCQFLSTFRAAGTSSVNFHLMSVQPVDVTKIFLMAE